MVYRLLQRQEKIRDLIEKGQLHLISQTARKAKIGVVIEANLDTLDTVPYLTHQDMTKQIRELSDLCDYVVVSLSSGGTGGPKSNGL